MSADDPAGSKDSADGWKPVKQLTRYIYIGHDVSVPSVCTYSRLKMMGWLIAGRIMNSK